MKVFSETVSSVKEFPNKVPHLNITVGWALIPLASLVLSTFPGALSWYSVDERGPVLVLSKDLSLVQHFLYVSPPPSTQRGSMKGL